MICTGYRDTEGLRVLDESRQVQAKALNKGASGPGTHSVTLALDARARHVFLNHYIDGVSKTWSFLIPFFQAVNLPEHLTSALDATSLAYFGHQARSEAALNAAIQKYVYALHRTGQAVRDHDAATRDTTILSTLLLDLFEKLQNTQPTDSGSYTGHISGAFALVKMRGPEGFQDASAGYVLVRLTTNLVISCMASSMRVPDGLQALRTYAARLLPSVDPKYQVCDLNMEYANLRSDTRSGCVAIEELIDRTEHLHDKYLILTKTMPCTWWFQSMTMEPRSERVFEGRYGLYPNRHIKQTCNVIRFIRIMLIESLIQYYTALKDGEDSYRGGRNLEERISNAITTIDDLALEICYSASQYIDCFGPASTKSNSSQRKDCDNHTPDEVLNCYSLIFPLYVSGRSQYVDASVQYWVQKQLRYMGSHFGIKNAEIVCQILEQTKENMSPWSIYGMLGSYSFAA